MTEQQGRYVPNQYRGSVESKNLAKFMSDQYLDAEKNAREQIFTGLPEMHFLLGEELAKCEVLQLENMQTNYLRLSDKYTNIETSAVPNENVQYLHKLIEKYQQQFIHVSNQILFWVQILLPKKQSSGSDTSQEFLVMVAAMIQKMQENSDGYEEQFIKYYTSRAQIIRQLMKKQVDDQLQSLVYIDLKQMMLAREVLSNLNINVLNLYRVINDGFEKIRDCSLQNGAEPPTYY